MAKKVDGYEAFLADVLATVPEDRRSMIEETFKNDAIRSELEKGYLRQSDFSRAHDNLRAERENFQHTVEEANTRINGWQEWYTNASGEYETMRAENQRLVALDGTDQRPVVQGMSQEDVTALLEARDRQAIAFADILTDLKLDHNKQFNENMLPHAWTRSAAKSWMRNSPRPVKRVREKHCPNTDCPWSMVPLSSMSSTVHLPSRLTPMTA
jgi:aconitase A